MVIRTPPLIFRLVLLPALLMMPLDASAQGPLQGRRTIRAVRAEEPPRIDGVLDDAVWQQAPASDGFVQRQPEQGVPSRFATRVRMAWDDANLYVAARMEDPDPERLRRLLTRRDTDSAAADLFAFAVDSYHDRRSAYAFFVNVSGVQRDLYLFDDVMGDDAWDAVWQSQVSIDDGGWNAEVAVPLSQLRFNGNPTWGVQFMRLVAREGEVSLWQYIPQEAGIEVSGYGVAKGFEQIEPPGYLEVRPYAAGGARMRQGGAQGDPFEAGLVPDLDAGLDLKYGLGPNWTLDATLNPDFGQVEADPAQVNLTDSQLFFEERRPFFLEGLQIFGAPQPGQTTLFYSRRVGAAPLAEPDAPAAAEYVDRPLDTPILGAAKVTGRSTGGTSLGVLEAVTAPVRERYADAEGRILAGEAVVQPLSNYLVARGTQDLAGGDTQVGAMATAVNRDLEGPLAEHLVQGAYAGGLDWDLGIADKEYYLSGLVEGSHLTGEPAALETVQTSFVRYAQRPDADHLELDPEARSLTGWRAQTRFGRRGGELFNWGVQLTAVSPNFEVNDLGFQNRADQLLFGTGVSLQNRKGNRLFQQWRAGIEGHGWTNFGGDAFDGEIAFWAWAITKGYQTLNLWFGGAPDGTSDRLLRGGPLAATPGWLHLWGYYGTDSRATAQASLEAAVGANRVGGKWWQADLNGRVQPMEPLVLELGVGLARDLQDAHYVDAYDDPAAVDTYGTRYVFADLDNVTTAATARVEWTFSPKLSLQTYLRGSVVSGAYGDLAWFARPGQRDFRPFQDSGAVSPVDGGWAVQAPGSTVRYEVDEPDFLFTSLQGNAVLRWEWRPGSTLFMVYQLDCAESVPGDSGAYDPAAWGRLCGDEGATHSLLAKFSWWWSM